MENNLTLLANQQSAEAGRNIYLNVVNEETKIPMELQEQFLMQLIRDNENTEFGRKYNFLYLNGLKAELLSPGWMEGKVFCTSEGTCVRQENGITIGCASAKNAEVLKGGESEQAKMMRAIYTSPVEAMIPEPGTDTKYLHMRFAMMEENVTGITVGFYNMLAHLLQYALDRCRRGRRNSGKPLRAGMRTRL